MGMIEECRALSDEELSRGLRFLASQEKHNVARLIAHLVEFDRRQLCVSEGGRSLFEHCVKVLGFEEADAYRRVKAARFARRHPAALKLLSEGVVSMSVLALLETLPNGADGEQWLKLTAGLSRRDAEAIIAEKYPQCARLDYMRRAAPVVQLVAVPPVFVEEAVPQAGGAPGSTNEGSSPVEWAPLPAPAAPVGRLWQDVVPVAAERVRIGFDAGTPLMRLIERARQVLRHKYPEGRFEDIVREALETLLDQKDPQRRLKLKASAAGGKERKRAHERLPIRSLRAYAAGRYIPAKVKTAVWARDDGRCAWRHGDGTPCGSRDAIEYDHIIPYAKGGRSEYRNLRLLCRAHNRLAAERAFPRPDGPQEVDA